ncbi:MAG TPA: tetratricopeptide repeat protein [bacterium]|nr:tetratricopeptide repeat protein [bacterium]
MNSRAFHKLIVVIIICLYAGVVRAEPVTDLIARADAWHEQHQPDRALEVLNQAAEQASDNAEVLWRIARAYYDKGILAPESEKESLYVESDKYARKAVETDSTNADAHVWVAIAVGKVALERGGKEKVELSREVKEEAEQAIRLDPEHDIAYHVLGRWHYEVATLSWVLKAVAKVVYGGLPEASIDESIRLLRQAATLAPEHINHHLQLAKSYTENNQDAEARQELQQALRLSPREIEDPEHLQEARDLLRKL